MAGEYRQSFHPDLPTSRLWGYSDATNVNLRYLGGVIVASAGRPVRINFKNNLPTRKPPHYSHLHPVPVDKGAFFQDASVLADNRVSVHLHGGFVPWISDGGPEGWFDPVGNRGESFVSAPDLPDPGPGAMNLYYPNEQSSRLMWYHDHAHDITRVNAYVGLASAYVLRDEIENYLIAAGYIPAREVPLILQDKTFVDQDAIDNGYVWGKVGDLWYPYLYEPNSQLPAGTGRWDYAPDVAPPGGVVGPLPVPSCVPEFFADTSVINGAAYPYLKVEPRHYRFRFLNGSQARMFNLQLYYADGTGTEIPVVPDPSGNWLVPDLTKVRPGPRMIQIQTEGGFLPFAVALNNPPVPFTAKLDATGSPIPSTITYNLLLGGAERADIIVDFSSCPVGSKLILYNDAPAPFPGGDPRNDYFTGDPDFSTQGGAPTTQAGFGPNTRTLMQFQVVSPSGPPDPPSMSVLEKQAVTGKGTSVLPPVALLKPSDAVRTRNLTLNEDFDDWGRLIQRLGTDVQNGLNTQGLPTWGRFYMDDPTEIPSAGDIEVWNIWNLTGDTHPIHFHLVNVQLLSRRPFDPGTFVGNVDATPPKFTGPPRNADANERGYKETVRMNPGEVTTVIMKFDLPTVPFEVPLSQRNSFNAHEYVWHCHILEHEEHDMMRPMLVKP